MEMIDRLEKPGHVVRERGFQVRRRVLMTRQPQVDQKTRGGPTPLFACLDELDDSFSSRSWPRFSAVCTRRRRC